MTFQYRDPAPVDLYRSLPTQTLDALDNYLERGTYPGGAMGAVLSNDLMQALARGDEGFVDKLPVLVRYLVNRCPSGAWGTAERVAWWCGIADDEARESYLRHYDAHRNYVAMRRQQDKEFAESCRDQMRMIQNAEPDKE